ncbi:MAG: hypothetical protein MJ016_07570, partial [Victivallaceae bacterium]|nr:hypothetical protein [Victivallaceae bacterium]
MSDFFFNCPRCGTSYCCDDSDRKNLFQCPKCSHFFTPEKTNGKICPSCGKSIPEAAVKCRHCGKILDASVKKSFSASRGPDFRKNLVGFLLLAVLLAAGIFGWREYSVRKAAKEAARREALEQDRLLAEKRRREEAARREAALQREREAEVKRRIAEEARRREAEAKRRAAEEAA